MRADGFLPSPRQGAAMAWQPLADVQAFFAGDRRWRNAFVGGVAGGTAGAIGVTVETASTSERILLVSVVALGMALALILLVGQFDRYRGE